MRGAVLAGLLVLLLGASGCGGGDDSQIAQLEAQISELEGQLAEAQQTVTSVRAASSTTLAQTTTTTRHTTTTTGATTTTPPGGASACADNPGSSEVTVTGDVLPALMDIPVPVGDVTVVIVEAGFIPSSFDDPFGMSGQLTAVGRFFAVRYTIHNDASSELQPSTQVAGDWRLTDGEKSWPLPDFLTEPGWASGAWSVGQGDMQPEEWVGAGFERTTWAVFDIPEGVEPVAVAWQLPGGRQICLGLP